VSTLGTHRPAILLYATLWRVALATVGAAGVLHAGVGYRIEKGSMAAKQRTRNPQAPPGKE
jgi:hypothetical protein